jgi:hypothetical protein
MDIWIAKIFISFRYKPLSSVKCYVGVGSTKDYFFIRI